MRTTFLLNATALALVCAGCGSSYGPLPGTWVEEDPPADVCPYSFQVFPRDSSSGVIVFDSGLPYTLFYELSESENSGNLEIFPATDLPSRYPKNPTKAAALRAEEKWRTEDERWRTTERAGPSGKALEIVYDRPGNVVDIRYADEVREEMRSISYSIPFSLDGEQLALSLSDGSRIVFRRTSENYKRAGLL
jgi:hypothetical protein